jgi:CRP-like cAMP-binding protein
MANLDFLQSVDIFKGLSDDQLNSIENLCSEKVYKAGEILFEDGKPADHFFLLSEGTVDLAFDLPGYIRTPATTMVSVGPGRAFGWSSLMPPYRYRLTAHCTSGTCKVLCLSRKPLRRLFDTDKKLGYQVTVNLATLVSSRFRRLMNLRGAVA